MAAHQIQLGGAPNICFNPRAALGRRRRFSSNFSSQKITHQRFRR